MDGGARAALGDMARLSPSERELLAALRTGKWRPGRRD